MTTFPPSFYFKYFVNLRINTDGSEAILKVAPAVTLEELYDAFKVSTSTKRALIEDDVRSSFRWTQDYEIALEGMSLSENTKVPVTFKATLPTAYRALTIDTIFTPILKFAQEWSTLRYIVDHTFGLIDRNSVGVIFPWVRGIIMDENYDFAKDAKNKKFFDIYSIRRKTDRQAIHTSIKAAMITSRKVVLMPSVLRDAAKTGDKLFTQSRLLKGKNESKASPNKIIFKPHISDFLVPQRIKDAVREMAEFQHELKEKQTNDW